MVYKKTTWCFSFPLTGPLVHPLERTLTTPPPVTVDNLMMTLSSKGLPLPNLLGSNRRRVFSEDAWLPRGFALAVVFNIILLYKWYHPQTPTALDDFQML